MRIVFLSFFISVISLTSCVNHNEVFLAKSKEEPAQKPPTYYRFMKALSQTNVAQINSLLDFRCEFKQYPGMTGWYGFYRDNMLMIGPFPLKDYRKIGTLSLTRPAGYRENDFSRFHVFSRSYDLYLYFGPECVWIEGSGESGSKQTRMFVY